MDALADLGMDEAQAVITSVVTFSENEEALVVMSIVVALGCLLNNDAQAFMKSDEYSSSQRTCD